MSEKKLMDFVAEARQNVEEISPEELSEKMEAGEDWLLVDVREPYEYEKIHVPNSLLIPRGLLEGAADPNTPHRIDALVNAREKPVAVMCATGGRAAMSVQRLREMGFGQVVNVAGGIKGWEAEDLPVESGAYTGQLP
ncbi:MULTISPECIES: rhodanese-like domain-containing protein [unclassified Thioalkalivibrio]|uniref:rhodanese-like domain-containing protein n=1 Tax=unclassified Thioalkalivibrio TaxID=2621013 RepID=UPI0003688FB0|nr:MULTISPECIES: rhodanese-like domain-containing protein [unclassified Thioalkalivibrio]